MTWIRKMDFSLNKALPKPKEEEKKQNKAKSEEKSDLAPTRPDQRLHWDFLTPEEVEAIKSKWQNLPEDALKRKANTIRKNNIEKKRVERQRRYFLREASDVEVVLWMESFKKRPLELRGFSKNKHVTK